MWLPEGVWVFYKMNLKEQCFHVYVAFVILGCRFKSGHLCAMSLFPGVLWLPPDRCYRPKTCTCPWREHKHFQLPAKLTAKVKGKLYSLSCFLSLSLLSFPKVLTDLETRRKHFKVSPDVVPIFCQLCPLVPSVPGLRPGPAVWFSLSMRWPLGLQVIHKRGTTLSRAY